MVARRDPPSGHWSFELAAFALKVGGLRGMTVVSGQ